MRKRMTCRGKVNKEIKKVEAEIEAKRNKVR